MDRRGDGFPVVYAIRAEADWFGDTWERYLCYWRQMETSGGELRCFGDPIGPERLIAGADFPNGSDQNLMSTRVTTWEATLKIALSRSSVAGSAESPPLTLWWRPCPVPLNHLL